MEVSTALLLFSGTFYGLAFVLHLLSFMEIKAGSHRIAFGFMRLGFLLATFYLAAEAIEQGFFLPVSNFSQAMAFFAWSLAFVYMVLVVKAQSESFGLILAPLLFLLVLAAELTHAKIDRELLKPVLLNPYFTIHIISAFFAYASFTLSFSAGILYLIQYRELKTKRAGQFYHKLPALEELERLIYQPLIWGAPLLLTAMGVGMLWSKASFGEFWIFDPKTIATGLVAGLYLLILYFRSVSGIRGKQVAVLSLIAFALVIFSFVGTRFIQGSHDFLQ